MISSTGSNPASMPISSMENLTTFVEDEEIIRSTQVPGFLLHRVWLDPANLPDVASCLEMIAAAQ